jgi:3D (Asp-Asp-Asp) domain-containing protein
MLIKPDVSMNKRYANLMLLVVLLLLFSGIFVPETTVLSQNLENAGPRRSDGPNPELPAFRALSTVKVVATAYYAGVESTGKHPGHPGYGITYSGVKARRDPLRLSTIAADPGVFPLGTILYVPGYGYGIVADTGSAIKGNKIDLYFDTKRQVYEEWGKREVNVHVIRRGNGKVTEAMVDEIGNKVYGRATIPAADIR